MNLPENPYDLFLINLSMIKTMIKKARSQMNNEDGLDMQIALLQSLINNLTNLKDSLSSVTTKKNLN